VRLVPRIAILASALLAIAAATAVAVMGPWRLPAADISPAGLDATAPAVAVGPDGAAVAAWSQAVPGGGLVQAATRPPGGAFGPPEDLSAFTGLGRDPQVAIGPDGTAFVVWLETISGINVIRARVREAGQAQFGPPVTLSDPAAVALPARLGVGPDGTATVAWPQAVGPETRARVRTRPPGGQFGPPEDLSATGGTASDVQVDTGGDGTTAVVWRFGALPVTQAAVRPPGGAFGPAVTVGPSGRPARDPDVAVAPDGSVTVIFAATDGANDIAQSVTRPPGGVFGSPTDVVSQLGVDASLTRVVAGPDGTVTALWRRGPLNGWEIEAAVRPPGGVFADPVRLSPLGHVGDTPRLAAAPDGTVTALWTGIAGGEITITSAVRLPGGAFAPGAVLSDPAGPASLPDVAAAPDGSAVAVWVRNDGSAVRVQAAVTASPPALRSPPVLGGDPRPGGTLTCAPGAWTGAQSLILTWLRDGTEVAAGAEYGVGEADRGRALVCRARAANPWGSLDAVTATVVVPPPPAAPPAPAPPAAAPPPVAPAPPRPAAAPVPIALPRVSGGARAGRTLTCVPGRFTAATRVRLAWLRDGRPIRRQTAARYRVRPADRGRVLTCRVTASGPGGSTTVVGLGVLVRR
jgi:hypothetical protein